MKIDNKNIEELYQAHQGKISDKWSLYLRKYDQLFAEFRNQNIRLLEIGVQNGGSLEIWANYFPRATALIGCDVNADCGGLTYDDERIGIVIGDANSDDTERAILLHGPAYDLVIDDGSHCSSDIIKSFVRYFSHLADGGIFVVEDMHCSYWEGFEGGLFSPFSSITFFKRLVDIINHEHWGVNRARKELLASFANTYGVSFDEEVLTHIHSIEFINSVCVIRKSLPSCNKLGQRKIAGEDARVEKYINDFIHCDDQVLDQSGNVWSTRLYPSDEELIQGLNEALVKRDDQISSLNEVLVKRDDQISSLNEALVKSDDQISSLNEALVNSDDQISSLNEALVKRDGQLSSFSRQQLALNSELLNLYAERATFGARIGRVITNYRARMAPIGTKRGSVVSLITKFFTSLAISGPKITALKTYTRVTSRVRAMCNRKRSMRAATRYLMDCDPRAHLPKIQGDDPKLDAWFEKFEPTAERLLAQIVEVAGYGYKPLISVIIPVYQVPLDVLEETLGSLECQSYSNWQACIVWSDIDDIAGWELLQARCNGDQRYRVKLLSENGGISRNSDAAFDLVEGEYIALLDHDDTLAPWAFFEIVKRLQQAPELDFIYSDKDSITADGRVRLNALFKPEWSPEMLHSVNYLTHLNVIRTSLVREIGGWRPETDGAQDWDLFFRITERTQKIARVPSILYHWRILPTSTATGLAAKPYAAMGQIKSQQDYFMRRGLAATVVPSPEGMYQVNWPVQAGSTDVVIYQKGTLEQLVVGLDVLRAVKQESIRRIHVIHSSPATDALNAFKCVWQENGISFTQVENANWCTALGAALSGDSAETTLLLAGDTTGISETLVEELSGWVAQHPDITWASAIALSLDSTTVYEAGRVVSEDHQSAPLFSGAPLHTFGWFGGPLWYRNTLACSPYAIAVKTCDARRVLPRLASNDGSRDNFVEFCLELSSEGRRGVVDPFARVHFSRLPEKTWPNDGYLFHSDPYFNPAFDRVSPLRLKS